MKKKLVTMFLIVAVLVACLVPATAFAGMDSGYAYYLDHWLAGHNQNSSYVTEITQKGWDKADLVIYGDHTSRMYDQGNPAMANPIYVPGPGVRYFQPILSAFANKGDTGYFNFKAGDNGCLTGGFWGSWTGAENNN